MTTIQALDEPIFERPSLIFSFGVCNIFISFVDGTYKIFNRHFDNVTYKDNKAAYCGLEINKNECLFGLEDGNGMLIRIIGEEIEILRQMWRQDSKSPNISYAITKLGFLNDEQLCAITENGEIIIISRQSFQTYKIINLPFQISTAAINSKYFVLSFQSFLVVFNPKNLKIFENLELPIFKSQSVSQLQIDGIKVYDEEAPQYWSQLAQINGNIYLTELAENYLFILTNTGYFYHCEVNEEKGSYSIEIQKIMKFKPTTPLSLHCYAQNFLHISLESSQTYNYNYKLKELSTIFNISDNRHLIASRFFKFEQYLIVVLAYKQKLSNLQEQFKNQIINGKLKIIKTIR